VRRMLATLAAALSSVGSASNAAERWSFGPFSMDALPGYTYKEGRSPAVYINANGSAALITVHVPDGKPSAEQAKELVANALRYARLTFEASAKKFGRATEDFSSKDLPSGNKLATLPVATQERSGTGYLLQFAVISNVGHIAIITVEGNGSLREANDILLPVVQSARFRN
jgi:hypothetical protein